MSLAIFLFHVIPGKEKSRISAHSHSVERSWCPASCCQLTAEASEDDRLVFLSRQSYSVAILVWLQCHKQMCLFKWHKRHQKQTQGWQLYLNLIFTYISQFVHSEKYFYSSILSLDWEKWACPGADHELKLLSFARDKIK